MNNTQTLNELATEIASARENMGFDNYVALIEDALVAAKQQGFRECAELVGKTTNNYTRHLERELRRRGWAHER